MAFCRSFLSVFAVIMMNGDFYLGVTLKPGGDFLWVVCLLRRVVQLITVPITLLHVDLPDIVTQICT